MIALKCPNCNAPLSVPEDQPRFFCQFCGTPVILSEALRPQPEPSAAGNSDRLTVPIPDHLHVEEFGNELTISWRWFSWIVLFLIPFCIAWNAFLIGWYSLASGAGMPGPMRIIFLVFPLAHVAVGLGLAYTVLTLLFNRTTVRVLQGELSVRYGPLYFPGGRRIAVDDIDQIYCQEKAHQGARGQQAGVQYQVMARLKSGRSVTLLSWNHDLEVARAVEQLLEDHLQIKNRLVAGEVTSP